MTSLIGRILGIEKETDEYVKTIQKTIEKNGIAVSLEEVAADAKSLWIAYSLTDVNGENDISMSSVQTAVDGESLALENQYSLDNSSGSEKINSKYFVAKFNRSRADHFQKFEIQIGTFQNQNEQVEERMYIVFHSQQIQKHCRRTQKKLTFKSLSQLRRIRRF